MQRLAAWPFWSVDDYDQITIFIGGINMYQPFTDKCFIIV
jgi:hypothetical protein